MGLNPIAVLSKSAGDPIHSIADRSGATTSALPYQGQATGSWTDNENVDSTLEPSPRVIPWFLGP